MTSQPITLQIHLLLDEQGNLTAALPEPEGEKVTIDRAAVKASSRTCVKKSEGEILVKRIKDAMETRGITSEELARKSGVGKTTLYTYFKSPGAAPLSKLLTLCRVAGISQITLTTGGTYQ